MKKGYTLVELLLMVAVLIFVIDGMSKYNPKEQFIVSSVISSEACSEGEIGMQMVANTIVNRAKLYQKSPYEIVTEKNQYAGLNNPNKEELYKQCGRASDKLVRNLFKLPDLTKGALYFKRPEEERKNWHKELTVSYMNHEFYK